MTPREWTSSNDPHPDAPHAMDERWRCTAFAKTKGERCSSFAMRGSSVCRMHGGAADQVRAAADRRLEQAAAERTLALGLAAAYGDGVPPVDPGEAMLQAVSWKYAEVVALRSKVAELDDEEFVWGMTRFKSGGDNRGTTEEARPSVWWSMLRRAEEQLVKFAAAARAAKCDERRIQLAESQGALVAQAMRQVLDQLHLSPEQLELVPTVVPAALRLMGGPMLRGEVVR